MPQFPNEIISCLKWYTSSKAPAKSERICESRDVFQARLDHMFRDLTGGQNSQTDFALIAALTGELGNNSFDHNLGLWRDQPGCWFDYQKSNPYVWTLVADRGQGVLRSLQKVDASIQSDQQAVEVAFSRGISGRSPEKRGNGLKFVRSVINGNSDRGIYFSSGQGTIELGQMDETFKSGFNDHVKKQAETGTFVVLSWKMKP